MARTFRRNDVDSFEASRVKFSDRKAAQRARARMFEDMGFDDGDALASRPIHGAQARAEARRALNGW